MNEEAKTLESRQIHDGKVVRLSVDRVELPNGKVAELEVIRHQGAAAVVPLTDAGEVLLVRQYRYATGGARGQARPGRGSRNVCDQGD